MREKLITAQAIKSKFLGKDEKHKSLLVLLEYYNNIVVLKLNEDIMKYHKTYFKYLKNK